MNKTSLRGLGLLAVILSLATGCGLSNSSITRNQGSERTLNFPTNRSLGKLYILEENLHFLSGSGEEEKGEAQGSVRIFVPDGWLLELRVSPEASTDLSTLSTLNPNDLQAISLYNTQVTDEGLSHLQKLSGLKSLDLSNTQINGTGLAYFNGLSGLKALNLTFTSVTDSGLADLKKIPNLQSLSLSKTKISDRALAYVKELPQLENLELYYTNVSDSGLQQIQQLTQLQSLNIGWTQVTDAGLSYLIGLTQLRKLNLDSTAL